MIVMLIFKYGNYRRRRDVGTVEIVPEMESRCEYLYVPCGSQLSNSRKSQKKKNTCRALFLYLTDYWEYLHVSCASQQFRKVTKGKHMQITALFSHLTGY